METPSSSSQSEAAPDGITQKQKNRRWRLNFDKHLLTFCVRAVFGFLLATFCATCLAWLMVMKVTGQTETCSEPTTEFTTMFFSLLSFAAGYFLGASPSVKRNKTPSLIQRVEEAGRVLIGAEPSAEQQPASNFPPDTPQVNFGENNV